MMMRWHFLIGFFGLLVTGTKIEAAAGSNGGYANPCREFGTADKLNTLYNDAHPDSGCPDGGGPSYRCAGVITRSGFTREGRTYFPNFLGIDDPIYTVGTSKLTSDTCPADIVDGGEYPPWCPGPDQIYTGSASFSYIRRDIAPNISILREWEETGFNSLRGDDGEPWPAWPGGGIVFLQEDIDGNPDVIFPNEGMSTFWDNDRLGNSWPQDGATFGRALCGNGPHFADMLLGIEGPIVPLYSVARYAAATCLPTAPGWDAVGLPEGYTRSCPASVLESVESYYEHWFSKVEMAFNSINCSSDDYNAHDIPALNITGKDVCNATLSNINLFPQLLACGIPRESFDKIMIPAAKTFPVSVLRGWLEQKDYISNETALGFGLWNEIPVKSWNGVGFSDIAAHLVMWYDETEGSMEAALKHAEDFFAASGMNGGPNIRIPVVYRNTTKLFFNPDVEYEELFACPDTGDDPYLRSLTPSSGTFDTTKPAFQLMMPLFSVMVIVLMV